MPLDRDLTKQLAYSFIQQHYPSEVEDLTASGS